MSQHEQDATRDEGSDSPRALCRRQPFVAWEEDEGYCLCFHGGGQGWVPLTTWSRHHRRPGQQAQMCSCLATGQTWVKLLVGRYRDREEEDLEARLALLEGLLMRLGGSPTRGEGPLWMQVEILENALEFDLRPPCGCPPNSLLAAA